MATSLLGEEWDRVSSWCDGKATPQVSPYLVAVGVLCHWFPPRTVAKARGAVWAFVSDLMREERVKVPPFVTVDVDPLLLLPLRRGVNAVHGG
jgi:hypothetical protein